MRQTGRTTRMLLELALYISKNYDKDKRVILVSHNLHYTTDLLRRLYSFFPSAKRFTYTSVTFGKVIVRPFVFSDLERPEVMTGIKWNAVFMDHFHREEITQKTIDRINILMRKGLI